MTNVADDIAVLKELRRELEALRRDTEILRTHDTPNSTMLSGLGFDITGVDLRRIALGDDAMRQYAIQYIEKRTEELERRISDLEARWIPQGPLN
jgi:prefoldin subunit 5